MIYDYDQEADVLSITLTQEPFNYAEEMGDIIVHFDKKRKPVYLEILQASSFIKKAAQKLPSDIRLDIASSLSGLVR